MEKVTDIEISDAAIEWINANPVGSPFASIALARAYETGMRDAYKRMNMYEPKKRKE